MPETNHIPVLTHFLREIKPVNIFELGCCHTTTPILDQMSLGWVTSYHSSRHTIESFKAQDVFDDLVKTDLIRYDTYESLLKHLNNSDRPDFALIGGPVSDRLSIAQSMIDAGVRCIILLNYDYQACNYHKIRSSGYEFKSFNNIVEGGETGVYLANLLRYIEVIDHVSSE